MTRLNQRRDDTNHIRLFINRLLITVKVGARILDFGCGAGQTVFKLRDMGFDAYGFDIHDAVAYRSDEDRQWFRFSKSTSQQSSAFTIDPETYSIPFGDDFFDVVHSTSVLEHVLDVRPMFKECARVLRRDGLAVHFFPDKYLMVEPHLCVPLASFVQSKAWLRFWTWLGATNEFQSERTVSQVTDAYKEYTRTGLCYRTKKELSSAASEYFGQVEFPPRCFMWPTGSRLSSLVCEGKRRTTDPQAGLVE